MKNTTYHKTTKLFCQTVLYQVSQTALLDSIGVEELTEVQLACLRFVALHDEPSLGELADGLRISNAAAAKLIDRLVKKQLVTRTEDSLDRRVLKLNLTEPARLLLEKVIFIERSYLENILDRMELHEREALELGMKAFLQAALLKPEQIDRICLYCGIEHEIDCPGNQKYLLLTGEHKKRV